MTTREVFSDCELRKGDLRRVISVRRLPNGDHIEIACLRANAEQAGIRLIPATEIAPLRTALAIARGSARSRPSVTGEFSMKSGAILRFIGSRVPGRHPMVQIALHDKGGAPRGRPLVFIGEELVALERAVQRIDRGSP